MSMGSVAAALPCPVAESQRAETAAPPFPTPAGDDSNTLESPPDRSRGAVRFDGRPARIMIVDDDAANVLLIRKFLKGYGYENFVVATEARRTIELIRREEPDVVLLDAAMPHISGIDILRAMDGDERLRNVPVIILTETAQASMKTEALELGAADFLTKPIDPSELVPRIRNVLTAKAHRDYLARHSEELEREIHERTAELEASRREVILCLARAAEFRDDDTGWHVMRVGRYAGVIAREMGFAEDWIEKLEQAAQLHDVGKIGIPDAILLKPGQLDPDEYELVQRHCKFGRRIIQPMSSAETSAVRGHAELGAGILSAANSPVLKLASTIAQTHHERWDGTGYPLGLAGDDIPIEGRITAVADVFDALSSQRPYKPPFPRQKCFQILEEGRGTQFDPRVLDAFFQR
ncbi:MAG: response regulator, partial [Planctomycetes bacterium]|nr:response regulator [Planctomycetota bacterium]